MSYNKVILMGRLTADPKMGATSDGTEYCTFTVACDRKFGKEKKADFISCTAWRQTAAFVSKYFNKGSMIHVEGSWQHEKYDKDGETRYSDKCNVDSVDFCGGKKDDSAPVQSVDISADEGSFQEIDDSELPF